MRRLSLLLLGISSVTGCELVLHRGDPMLESTTATSSSSTTSGGSGGSGGSLMLTVGPPDFAYVGATTGIGVHVVRQGNLNGPLNITVDDPSGSVSGDPLMLAAGATDGTLTLSRKNQSFVGIAHVTVHASTTDLAHDSTAPLDAVVPGPSGSLDTTFGMTGIVKSNPVAGASAALNAVAIDAAGNIAAVGDEGPTSGGGVFVLRFAPDGSPLGMPFVHPWPAYNTSFAIGVDHADRIVIGGLAPSGGKDTATVYRFNPTTGALDMAFGAGSGLVQHNALGLGTGAAQGIAVLPNDGIVAVGYSYDTLANDQGTVMQFDSGGKIMTSSDRALPGNLSSTVLQATGSVLEPDGIHVAIAGSGFTGTYLTRYNASTGNFEFPPTMNKYFSFKPSGSTSTKALAIAAVVSNGAVQRYLLAGSTDVPMNQMLVVAATTQAMLDTSFAQGSGFAVIGATNSQANGIAIDRFGRPVIVGTVFNATNDIALLRLTAAGLSDTTTFDLGAFNGNASGLAIALDHYDRIVIAGWVDVAGSREPFVARYWP